MRSMLGSTLIVVALTAPLLTGCGKTTPPQQATQATEPAAPAASDPLPMDPELRHGTLANGLKWFIETNGKPEARAELRLIVNAGSINEDDDQRGLAHWVEHMAFNGTEHFAGNDLVKYLEGVGARFGPDLNAYTSFDETVYMLQVPTDDQEVFEKSFLVLEDWAHGLLFDKVEGDKERGVVMDEWRRGLGAGRRAYDAAHAVRYHGSKYAVRMPIGTEDSLKNADLDALERFYRDWYRPDLMAVAVVGDVDPDAVQALIEQHFAGIEGPENPRERETYEVPDHEVTLASVFTDPELTSTGLSLHQWVDWGWENTHGEYRDNLIEDLALGIINERLGDLAMATDSPFVSASVAEYAQTRDKAVRRVSVSAREDSPLEAFEAVLTEVRRAQLHGFTAAEVERARTRALANMERQWQRRDTTPSSRHVGEIVRHFLEGENMPGLAYEYELTNRYIPEISADELDAWAQTWLTDPGNRVITASMPAKDGVTAPTEPELVALVDRVLTSDVPPWEDKPVPASLVSAAPERGAIAEREELADLGITRWTLSNGVEVLLKPTDFTDDEVLISAWSWGGSSVADDDAYWSAWVADNIRERSGLGDLDKRQLEKFLTGRQTGLRSWVGAHSEGVSGWAAPADLGLALELTYLHFTAPRFDAEAADGYLKNRAERLKNRDLDPRSAFSDLIAELHHDNHLRERPMTLDDLEKVDLEQARAFYEGRFADADGFTFAFVGDFEVSAMEPLVTQWLATLPTVDGDDTWVDREVPVRDGPARREVRKGLEPKATVRLVMHGDAEFTRDNVHDLSAMTNVLGVKLRERLREDLGGTYSVGAWGGISHVPDEEYTVTISFSCEPERVDELIEAANAEMNAMREAPVEQSYIDAYLAKQRRQRELDLRENRSWLSWMSAYDQREWPLSDILAFDALLAGDTAEAIHQTARQYLHPDQALVAVLLPGDATADAE